MWFIYGALCCALGIILYYFDFYYGFRKRRSGDHPLIISIVFLSWLLPFLSLVILLPFDIWNSSRGGDGIAHRGHLKILWSVIYWITFSLAWFILPFIRGMMYSGAWTWTRKAYKSCVYNVKFYLFSLIVGISLFAGLAIIIKPSQRLIFLFFTNIRGISNGFGLLMFLIPLGHALAFIPISLLEGIDERLRKRYRGAPTLFHSMKNGNECFKKSCYKIFILLGNWEREMEFWDSSPFLEHGLQALKNDLGDFEPSAGGNQPTFEEVPMLPLTASSLEDERCKHNIILKKRDRLLGAWNVFSKETWALEDAAALGFDGFSSKVKRITMLITLGFFILIIVWGEISIPFKDGWNPLVWSISDNNGNGGGEEYQLLAKEFVLWGSLATFAVMAISNFIGPFLRRIWMPDSMVLLGDGKTALSSLLSYGCVWCRLVFPLLMNYVAFFKGPFNTAFNDFMGPIQSVTIFAEIDCVRVGIPIVLLASIVMGSMSFLSNGLYVKVIDKIIFSTLYDDGMHLEEWNLIGLRAEEEGEDEEEGKVLLRQERLRCNLRSPV